MAVERALISVFDKTGIVEFAKRLAALRIEILSTGGTSKLLREAGVEVRDVSDFTGWPEMLGGRVKTLHPKVHGGLLYRRKHAEDEKQAAEHGIAPIDLVVVNLYPFEATAAKAGLTAEELIENIDIGGPTMLRSAAKNFESVTVVTDPSDYARVAGELESARETSLATRMDLARKVFATTSRYDGMITTELERLSAASGHVALAEKPLLPERVHIALRRQQELRYGENPHQAAALYVPAGRAARGPGCGEAASRQGAFVQQFCGPGSGAQPCRGVQEARGGDHQAQQSLRHGGAGDASGRLPEGVCVRSHLGVRRSAGFQSPLWTRVRRRRSPSCSWNALWRRVLTRRPKRFSRRRKICGCWNCPREGSNPSGSCNSRGFLGGCWCSNQILGN